MKSRLFSLKSRKREVTRLARKPYFKTLRATLHVRTSVFPSLLVCQLLWAVVLCLKGNQIARPAFANARSDCTNHKTEFQYQILNFLGKHICTFVDDPTNI